MSHYECKYCDRPAGLYGIPVTVGSEQICACGAEWGDAAILVEDEGQDNFMSDEYSDWENNSHREDDEDDDDLDGEYICGCKWITGCVCDYWVEEDLNES